MTASLHHFGTLQHGAARLHDVMVESYNAELRDDRAAFVGDRANDGALRDVIERWRSYLRVWGADPFHGAPTATLNKERLDHELKNGSNDARALLMRVGEEFSDRLVQVIHEFRRLPQWQPVERIAVGGGFSGSTFGRQVIQRAARKSTSDGGPDVRPISEHPDHAGLIGAVHLLAEWPAPCDGMLAVDIGGTKLRVGLLKVVAGDTSPATAHVVVCRVWRHRDQAPSRDILVAHLIDFLDELVTDARERGWRLAPIVGIACPGLIDEDGRITRGAQNLPGDWEDPRFNLADRVRDALSRQAGAAMQVVVHNDAVLQGLSELPAMRDINHWGIFTIGTGLGNACFARI